MIIETVLSVPIEFLGLLAQDGAAAPPGGVPGAGAEGAAQNPGGLGVLFENPLLPIGILFFLFYFIVLAPEKKRKRKEQEMLSQIGKNDRVVTAGGIHGVVVSSRPESQVVTIRIDDKQNVRIRVNRSAIARVGGDVGTEQSDNGSSSSEDDD
ncbi:MAG: preprotein translocase subunit YajC [Rhodopirellula sp.]|nr:preprotein translocase subunit YajC [Rhodopirellula sp.]